MGAHRKSDASFNFQPWVASSSTKSKASSFVTQSTCDTWLKWDVNIIQKKDRNNKQFHLISELNSVEFAGMFKQLRPDDFRDGCILSTIFSSYVDYVKWKIKVQTWMWSWWTGLHQPTHGSYQLRPRISSLSSSSSWMIVMFMSRFCKYNLSTVQCLTMTEEWKLESLTFLYIGSSAWSISSNK